MNETDLVARILSNLDDTMEDMLALLGEIRHGIQGFDRKAQARTQLFAAYQQKLDDYEASASELTEFLQQLLPEQGTTPATPAPAEAGSRPTTDFSGYSTIGLNESWKKKHPAGFVFQGKPHPNKLRWNRLYQVLCQQLAETYPERFDTLPSAAELMSNRGRRLFVRDTGGSGNYLPVGRGIYADVKLEANYIRDNIVELLKYFSIDEASLTVYQR